MKFFSYLSVELNCIFHSKTLYLIMVLTMICPMAGYKLYKTTRISTSSGDLIANTCIAGAIGGGVLFAVLTLLEFNRVRKYQTEVLTNSIVSPLVLNVVRLFAIGITASISVSITALLYFPYTFIKSGNIFDAYTYWNSFFLLMLPSILLSILVVSAFYQIFCRVDISMIIFIAFMLLSFSKLFRGNNILHWIKPSVPTLSDDFSNTVVFRLMEHNRLFWFLVIGGLWLVGLLCVRHYGKGLFGSILHNSRKIYIPLLVVALISSSCYAYINQPFVYKQLEEDDSDDNKQLELSNTDFEISFDTNEGSLSGKATYSLQNLSGSDQECRIIRLLDYSFHKIMANGKEITLKKSNSNNGTIVINVPNDQKIKLDIEYSSVPKITEKLSDFDYTTNISDKYIDLSSYEIFPRLRVAKSKENSHITGKLTMPGGLMPVVNGAQRDESGKIVANATADTVKLLSENEHNKTWLIQVNGNRFDLVAGDYVMKQLGDQNMPVQFYYSRKIEPKMQQMSAEKVMKDTIKYCTTHYGKLHDVSENNPIKVLEVTAFTGGGVTLPNFSTMGEDLFSDKNLSDKLKGAGSAEILAHEISHQWFGVKCGGSGEGLAVYTTYRIAKEKYGEEYAQKNYVDKWKQGAKEQDNNFYNRNPEYLEGLPEKYADEISEYNRATREYEKMPLQILKATELVGGEDKMDKILAKLYEKTRTKAISWQDFLDECGLEEEDLNIE